MQKKSNNTVIGHLRGSAVRTNYAMLSIASTNHESHGSCHRRSSPCSIIKSLEEQLPFETAACPPVGNGRRERIVLGLAEAVTLREISN